ncbi:MAG: Gfo/Idh/MocA family oxidoreductase [Bacteroidota bacterium]
MQRRHFLQTAGSALMAAAAPAIIPASALGRGSRPAPSDRVTVAFIGTGNQGLNNLFGILADERAQVVAVCDVNESSPGYWNGGIAGREPARQYVEWHYAKDKQNGAYHGCSSYADFRAVLARTDIDAVVLSLPDHWHAYPTIAAAQAGKHIYGEKPLSLTVREGRLMSDAVRDNGVVFQTGSQQRSMANMRRACELVRNGILGDVHTIQVGQPSGTPDFGKVAHRHAPEPVPDGFDYDLWLGPAPEAPYSPARCHVNFRWLLDYSGGQITDWGGHHPDIAQWAMGMDESGPVRIKNARGTWSDHPLYDTANTYHFEAEYANGTTMVISTDNRHGVRFEGMDGWVFVTRRNQEWSSDELWNAELGSDAIRLPVSDNHFRNFIDHVLAGTQPVAPIEAAHRSITIAHLGNIALKTGRDLQWDPETEQIIGDASASGMLSRPARAPWSLEALVSG